MGRVRDFDDASALTGAEYFYADDGVNDVRVTANQVKAFNILNWVVPQQFGAVADGDSHPLSEFYGDLATAQAAYNDAFYFVTDLGQEIDYCACKAASNLAFGADTVAPVNPDDFLVCGATLTGGTDIEINEGEPDLVVNELVGFTAFFVYMSVPLLTFSSPIIANTTRVVTVASNIDLSGGDSLYAFGRGEHGSAGVRLNRPVYLPQGSYRFGNDTWLIRNLASGMIMGAGKLATTIRGNATILAFDGIWYSTIRDFSMQVQTDTATAAFELDGNVPGHPYTTRGVQGVHCEQLLIDGGGGLYAFAFNRQGGSGGQGDQCTFVNLHLQNTSFACYYQIGFNSLSNTFISGNVQNYTKYGLYALNGTFGVFNTAFQSTHGVEMVLNNGFDIKVGNSGAFNNCPFYGCRTESLQFLEQLGGVNADVRGCTGNAATQGWSAETTKAVGDGVIGNNGTLQVVTQAGATGLVEPTWGGFASGDPTVGDGDVEWVEVACTFISCASGSVDYKTCFMTGLQAYVSGPPQQGYVPVIQTSDYTFLPWDHAVIVDASAGDVTITLESDAGGRGRTCTVKRLDANYDNEVIVDGIAGFEFTTGTDRIPPGGWKTYMHGFDLGLAVRWDVIASSEGQRAVRHYTGSDATIAAQRNFDGIIVIDKVDDEETNVALPFSSTRFAGRPLKIVDGKGDAATYNITITAEPPELINGAATYVINTNYGSVDLYPHPNEAGWFT